MAPSRPWLPHGYGQRASPSSPRLALFLEPLVMGAATAAAAMVAGEVACLAIIRFVIPRWVDFLNTHVTLSEQDVSRVVHSRIGGLVMVLVFFPWVLLYVVTLLTAALAGRKATSATSSVWPPSRALRIVCAFAAGSLAAALAWVVTALLYPAGDSIAVTVHRIVLLCGIPLAALAFSCVATRPPRCKRG